MDTCQKNKTQQLAWDFFENPKVFVNFVSVYKDGEASQINVWVRWEIINIVSLYL